MSQKDRRMENQEGKLLRFAAGRGEQVGERKREWGSKIGCRKSGCQCPFGKKVVVSVRLGRNWPILVCQTTWTAGSVGVGLPQPGR